MNPPRLTEIIIGRWIFLKKDYRPYTHSQLFTTNRSPAPDTFHMYHSYTVLFYPVASSLAHEALGYFERFFYVNARKATP